MTERNVKDMRDQNLVNALREHAEWAEGNQWETPITLCDDLAEAADVAPVTRCENCAFSQSNGWVCGGTALMPQHRTFPNSFCSDGERGEDA